MLIDRIGTILAAKVIPPVVDAVAAEVQKHVPSIVKAVVSAVTATMRELAVDTGKQVTEAIPGDLDDKVLGIVFDALGWRH